MIKMSARMNKLLQCKVRINPRGLSSYFNVLLSLNVVHVKLDIVLHEELYNDPRELHEQETKEKVLNRLNRDEIGLYVIQLPNRGELSVHVMP